MAVRFLLLHLFILQVSSQTFQVKIGIINERNAISNDLINRTKLFYVDQFRILHGGAVTSVTVDVLDSTDAILKVCQHSNLNALVTVGGCATVHQMTLLAQSLNLPHIAIPTDPSCDFKSIPDFTFLAQIHSTIISNATVRVLENLNVHDVVFISSETNYLPLAKELMWNFGLHHTSFWSYTYSANTTSANLQSEFKGKHRHFVVLLDPSSVFEFYRKAAAAQIMQQHYFFITIDTGFNIDSIKSILPNNSNVMVINEAVPTKEQSKACGEETKLLYPACDVLAVKVVESRFRDAMVILGLASRSAHQAGSLGASSATCNGPVPYASGTSLRTAISNLKSPEIYQNQSPFGADRHLAVIGVDIWATVTESVTSNGTNFYITANLNRTTDTLIITSAGHPNIFPNTFTGFKGKEVWICSPQFAPFIDYTGKNYSDSSREVYGMGIDIINYLAQPDIMNFIPKIKEAPDGQFGGQQANSPFYTGCIGEVQKGTFMFAGSAFSNSVLRDQVIDFTIAIYEEPVAIMLKLSNETNKLWNVFKPLKTDIYAVILAAAVAASLASWLFSKFSPFSGWNLRINFAIKDEVWFKEHLWNVLGSVLQQGQEFYPTTFSSRCVLAFWWVMTVIIMACHTGDLIAFLTVKEQSARVESLAEFTTKNDIIPQVVEGYSIQQIFKESEDRFYKSIGQRMTATANIEICKESVLKSESGNLACITDQSVLALYAGQNCESLYLVPDYFNYVAISFVIPEDAFFKDVINGHFQKLHESGLMKSLLDKYFKINNCKSGSTQSSSPITIAGAGGAFIITLGLYGLAFIVLGVELIVYRLTKSKVEFQDG